MSTFEVKIIKIDAIEPIEGADAIELAKVADYRSVVKKGQFKPGDLAAYIPEAAVLPDWLIENMGLTGRLAGAAKNRVKAVKLRGCLSQGLLLSANPGSTDDRVLIVSEPYEGNQGAGIHKLGDNIADALGIIKYEPVVPTHMAGEVVDIGSEHTLNYNIENLKKYPNVIKEGTEVQVTEKIHGTFAMFGFNPHINNHEIIEKCKFAASKGLGSRGLVFKDNERNVNNTYVKMFNKLRDHRNADIFTQLTNAYSEEQVSDSAKCVLDEIVLEVNNREPGKDSRFYVLNEPLYILGEIYGKGIQDLAYNTNENQFRIFDVYVGKPGQGRYLNYNEMVAVAEQLKIPTVDLLYKGPYSRAKMDELAKGNTITGGGQHIREGIVIKPVVEERHDELGRVILKHISEDYLLRSNKDATEYQ